MRNSLKLIIAGSVLALASGTALAHDGIGLNFSIAVPGAYVESAPAYYPPPAYVAPPAVYYDARPGTYYAAPPPAYYAAPPRVYYGAPPGMSVYYRPWHEGYRDGRYWHRDRDRRDDDD